MKSISIPTLLIIAALMLSPALASQEAGDLGTCMTDSLTWKERKQLAIWVYFAMSAHPEIQPYASVSEEQQDATDRFIGKLITRLMVEDCPAQASAAMQNQNSNAIGKAFEFVGAVAIQELMTNEGVTNTIAGFEKYLDKDKLNALGISEPAEGD